MDDTLLMQELEAFQDLPAPPLDRIPPNHGILLDVATAYNKITTYKSIATQGERRRGDRGDAIKERYRQR